MKHWLPTTRKISPMTSAVLVTSASTGLWLAWIASVMTASQWMRR